MSTTQFFICQAYPAGIGTVHLCDGCRGFIGPVPLPALDEKIWNY